MTEHIATFGGWHAPERRAGDAVWWGVRRRLGMRTSRRPRALESAAAVRKANREIALEALKQNAVALESASGDESGPRDRVPGHEAE